MKHLILALPIAALMFFSVQCKKFHTYTCEVDTSKTGYELAEAYDNCTVWNGAIVKSCV